MAGWFIGRPLLFAASCVVELVIKTALLDDQASWARDQTATTSRSFS